MTAGEELAGRIERAIDAAEAAWPGFRVPRAAFRERVLSLVTAEGVDPAPALDRLLTADLYLAQGCVLQIPGAIRAFEAMYLNRLRARAARFRAMNVQVDEVRREIEDNLLLGRGGAGPKIAQYAGRAPLAHFVAAAIRNAAHTLIRRQRVRPKVNIDAVASQLLAPPDSGTRMIAARHDPAIQTAVRAALAKLDRRKRTIVRLHLSRGVSLTQIARMLNVHQSTVSRSLDAALEQLHAEIRRELREVHRLGDTEMESIVRDVRSHLDLSLSRLLGDTGAGF